MRKYFQNTITTPTYVNGVKLLFGDEYFERDDGSWYVMRHGVIIASSLVEEKKEERVDTNVEGTVVLENMSKKELEIYALDKFGVDLDLRKSKKALIRQIKDMEG